MVTIIPPGPMPAVLHIKQPNFPHLRFEYHPETKRVYLIRLTVQPLIGDLIAQNVPDHGSAINTVNVWLRGYREGLGLKSPPKPPTEKADAEDH
jgi:hypothetical protein